MHLPVVSARLLLVAGLAGLLLGVWFALAATPASAFGSSEPPPGPPSVNAGGYMTCGVLDDGTAACWGQDDAPGDGNTAPGMATPPDHVTFEDVNTGYGTACGVTTDAEVVCWGNDRFDKVSGVPAGEYTHVVPGLNYVCALGADGAVTCWGGDDPAAPGADPDQLVVEDAPDGAFTQLTVGIRHACALDADGAVTCWGFNADGQIDVPEGSFSHVNAGNFTTCAIRGDGTAVCWGRNQSGQHDVPDGTFTQLSTGFAHVCGLREDGTVTCWGRDSEAQASPPAGTFSHVSAGTFHSCGMPTDGAPAVCWGNNQGGRVQPSMNADDPWPPAVEGQASSFQLTMDTNVAPAPTFSVIDGELPAGLTLAPDGELAGTPTETGDFTVTVAATNGLSPTDCVVGATGSLPCTFDDPDSPATATRVFDVTVVADAAEPGAIAGQVTDVDSGEPIADADVDVVHSGGVAAGEATTDGDGAYTVADLAPGSYTVTAAHDAYESATTDGVDVAEGATTTIDFALQAHPPLVIESVWANLFEGQSDGLYVEWSERINVQFATPEGFTRYTIHEEAGCTDTAIATGEAGFWTFARPATRDVPFDGWDNVTEGETYHLRVLADTESAFATGVANTETCVEFVALLHPDDRPDPGTIEGTVTSAADGAAIEEAAVTVTGAGGDEVAVTTGADGAYAVADLEPGTYTVTAEADGHVTATTDGVEVTEAATTTVDFALELVDPTHRDECMDDGWADYGFDNQGRCIQFVQTGKDSR